MTELTAIDAGHDWTLTDLRAREVLEEQVKIRGDVCLRSVLDCILSVNVTTGCHVEVRTDGEGVLLSRHREVDEVVQCTETVRRDVHITLVELIEEILPNIVNYSPENVFR